MACCYVHDVMCILQKRIIGIFQGQHVAVTSTVEVQFLHAICELVCDQARG